MNEPLLEKVKYDNNSVNDITRKILKNVIIEMVNILEIRYFFLPHLVIIAVLIFFFNSTSYESEYIKHTKRGMMVRNKKKPYFIALFDINPVLYDGGTKILLEQ